MQAVREQIDAEVIRRLVELGAKVRQDIRASSIWMLNDERDKASYAGLEALMTMDLLCYDYITRFGYALAAGVDGIRASVFIGPA